MDIKDFTKEVRRAHKMYCPKNSGGRCNPKCPLDKHGCWCSYLDREKSDPDGFDAVYEDVSKWSDSHPIRFRQDELLNIFPKAETRKGVLYICPKQVYIELADYDRCRKMSCDDCRKDFWLSPIDESEVTE